MTVSTMVPMKGAAVSIEATVAGVRVTLAAMEIAVVVIVIGTIGALLVVAT